MKRNRILNISEYLKKKINKIKEHFNQGGRRLHSRDTREKRLKIFFLFFFFLFLPPFREDETRPCAWYRGFRFVSHFHPRIFLPWLTIAIALPPFLTLRTHSKRSVSYCAVTGMSLLDTAAFDSVFHVTLYKVLEILSFRRVVAEWNRVKWRKIWLWKYNVWNLERVYVFNWNFFNFEFYLYLFRVLLSCKIEFTWYQYMKYMSDMIWLKKKNSLFEY